jgi:hypothetical protein
VVTAVKVAASVADSRADKAVKVAASAAAVADKAVNRVVKASAEIIQMPKAQQKPKHPKQQQLKADLIKKIKTGYFNITTKVYTVCIRFFTNDNLKKIYT